MTYEPIDKPRMVINAWRATGMIDQAIADAAGLDQKTIYSIRMQETKRCQTFVFDALMNLGMPEVPDVSSYEYLPSNSLVGKIGSERRLQALIAEGFSRVFLAERIGIDRSSLDRLIDKRYIRDGKPHEFITASLAYKISELYEEFAATDPLIFQKIQPVNRCKNYASKRGFVPSRYWEWDKLDDPDGFPNLNGDCGTVKGYNKHKRAGESRCDACKKASIIHRNEIRNLDGGYQGDRRKFNGSTNKKLSNADVIDIRRMYGEGKARGEIASMYNMNPNYIGKIARGELR